MKVATAIQLALLAVIAIALLVLDRILRIGKFMRRYSCTRPPCEDETIVFDRGGIQCGVGMPTCPSNMRCGNGYCISTQPPNVKEKNPIPVTPTAIF